MDLLTPLQTATTTASSPSTTGQPTASQDQKNAFLSAMTAALNKTTVLADANGDTDDDDGSSLTVKIGI